MGPNLSGVFMVFGVVLRLDYSSLVPWEILLVCYDPILGPFWIYFGYYYQDVCGILI